MIQQTSLLDLALQSKSRVTRRETFLAEMEHVVPWAELVALIEPVYPKGHRGRPPHWHRTHAASVLRPVVEPLFR